MRVTKADAEKVLAAVNKAFAAWTGEFDRPTLRADWDWLSPESPVPYAITWEGGPYEWAYLVPDGGVEQEFGFKVDPIDIPENVFIEHETTWAIGLYPKE